MKTILWDDGGASLEILRSIDAHNPFVVIVSGPVAQAFEATLGKGTVGIAPETIRSMARSHGSPNNSPQDYAKQRL